MASSRSQRGAPANMQPTPVPSQSGPITKRPIIEQVTPKRRQELMVEEPTNRASATAVIQTAERLINHAKELHDHKGLNDIVGKLNQYSALDMTDQTLAARRLQDTVIKQSAVNALQAMRDASKTGGAIGQVTEKEWPILEQSLAALGAAQSKADYQKALTNLQTQLQSSAARIRQAYESTYGPLQYKSVPHVDQGRSSNGAPRVVNW